MQRPAASLSRSSPKPVHRARSRSRRPRRHPKPPPRPRPAAAGRSAPSEPATPPKPPLTWPKIPATTPPTPQHPTVPARPRFAGPAAGKWSGGQAGQNTEARYAASAIRPWSSSDACAITRAHGMFPRRRPDPTAGNTDGDTAGDTARATTRDTRTATGRPATDSEAAQVF
jgi:hypothetical protein